MGDSLGITTLQRAYGSGSTSPSEVVTRLYPALEAEEGTFITLAPLNTLLERCRWASCTPCQAQLLCMLGPADSAAKHIDLDNHAEVHMVEAETIMSPWLLMTCFGPAALSGGICGSSGLL